MPEKQSVGLVLAGGGARGAYELGALSVLLPVLEERGERPSIIVGTSVGAINAAGIAATSHLPATEAVSRELQRWREVDRGAVIRPILAGLPFRLLRYGGELLSLPGVRLSGLLDPSPLRRNLRRWIEWEQLHRNLAAGPVQALAVIATAAYTGRTVAFVEGDTGGKLSSSRIIEYIEAPLDHEHVLASAAIPILFPAVRIEQPEHARGWYIDGATRLNTPIKPALDLGAQRLVVVGTDSIASEPPSPNHHDAPPPDLGASATHLLQGALADPLIDDVRKLADINTFYAGEEGAPAAASRRRSHGKSPYRRIPSIFIGPRTPGAIAELASETFHARYGGVKGVRSPDLVVLARLLGGQDHAHGELLSYLLFDKDFIDGLIEMGTEDARAWLDAASDPSELWRTDPRTVVADAAVDTGDGPLPAATS